MAKKAKKETQVKSVDSRKPAQGSRPGAEEIDGRAVKQRAQNLDGLVPLLKQYGKKKHPLEYKSAYELLVAVLLSARDSDRHINSLTPVLFERFPDMAALSQAEPADLLEIMGKVSNSGNKSKWLCELARQVQNDAAIPRDLAGLTALPGIGRKSANVIMGELGYAMEGVMVDLHVLRVAPRIGLATGKTPEKIEKELMAFFPARDWKAAGMALTHLGREVCRPRPKCAECIVNTVCEYDQKGAEK